MANTEVAWGETLLQCTGLTKRFGGLVAVDNVNMELKKGELLALIGPNGAGKTTVFNMLAGAYNPTSGSIMYNGVELNAKRSDQICKMGVGRTYQICQPFGHMTVLDNVMVGAFVKYPKARDAREKARDVLERVGLYHRVDALGSSLTLPELKRMEVARALATSPEILLLDEVIAGLNPTEVDKFVELTMSIHETEKLSIIIIEHVMRAIMRLAQRILVLNQGVLIASGTPAEVSSNPLVIESYLGRGGGVKNA